MSEKNKILIVDDSKTTRKAAEKILSGKYIVHEAVNGKDAWKLIEKNPDFAVIFADIQMPEMNGLQLLQHIRTSSDRHIAQKPVIMVTGHSDSHAAMRAVFKMGATGFISKPFSDIDLISCAHSYINLNQRLNHLEEMLDINRQSGLQNASHFKDKSKDKEDISNVLSHKLEHSIIYSESLPHIIDGDFNKVPDDHLTHLMKILKPFMRYATIKIDTL